MTDMQPIPIRELREQGRPMNLAWTIMYGGETVIIPLDALTALLDAVEAAHRLVFEVRYFDDHTPEECAVIRAAVQVEGGLARFDFGDGEDES